VPVTANIVEERCGRHYMYRMIWMKLKVFLVLGRGLIGHRIYFFLNRKIFMGELYGRR
jgi:hypothetical protein